MVFHLALTRTERRELQKSFARARNSNPEDKKANGGITALAFPCILCSGVCNLQGPAHGTHCCHLNSYCTIFIRHLCKIKATMYGFLHEFPEKSLCKVHNSDSSSLHLKLNNNQKKQTLKVMTNRS